MQAGGGYAEFDTLFETSLSSTAMHPRWVETLDLVEIRQCGSCAAGERAPECLAASERAGMADLLLPHVLERMLVVVPPRNGLDFDLLLALLQSNGIGHAVR